MATLGSDEPSSPATFVPLHDDDAAGSDSGSAAALPNKKRSAAALAASLVLDDASVVAPHAAAGAAPKTQADLDFERLVAGEGPMANASSALAKHAALASNAEAAAEERTRAMTQVSRFEAMLTSSFESLEELLDDVRRSSSKPSSSLRKEALSMARRSNRRFSVTTPSTVPARVTAESELDGGRSTDSITPADHSRLRKELDRTPLWDDYTVPEYLTSEYDPDTRRNVLVAGSLNGIIHWISDYASRNDAERYRFFMAYQSLMTPAALVQKLHEKFHTPDAELPPYPLFSSLFNDMVSLQKENVLRTLLFWLRVRFDQDFLAKKELKPVTALVTDVLADAGSDGAGPAGVASPPAANGKGGAETPPPPVRSPAERVVDAAQDIRALLRSKRSSRKKSLLPSSVGLSQTGMSLVFTELDSAELAEQMTLREIELWGALNVDEFHGLPWMKPETVHLCPNIINIIEHFNSQTSWLTAVVVRESRKAGRNAAISKIVALGEHFVELRNYNGVMTCLAALNGAPVQRLKRTWKSTSRKARKALATLNETMDMSSNFKRYRAALTAAPKDVGIIPYFGIVLSDLCMIEEGNARDAADAPPGIYNYQRVRLIGKVLNQVYELKKSHALYSITKNSPLLTFIINKENEDLTDDHLYQLSIAAENDSGRRSRNLTAASGEDDDVGA